MKIKLLHITPQIEVAYVGPDISEGPLPAFFYFSLSKEESLTLDPFNQPVQFLAEHPIRIFSLTIPGHGPGLDPTKALSIWAEKISQGEDILTPFFDEIVFAVESLIEKQIVIPEKSALGGLSRGAFIAAHAAAKLPQIPFLLGYAPLTQLEITKEFQLMQDNPIVKSLDVMHLTEKLTHRNIRFYIGNRDVRVGTENCFKFIHKLVETDFQHKIRSPQVELIINPSIGYKGHGTSPEVFRDGVHWIIKKLWEP